MGWCMRGPLYTLHTHYSGASRFTINETQSGFDDYPMDLILDIFIVIYVGVKYTLGFTIRVALGRPIKVELPF